jgi:putative aldouronate transport system permease protein
MDADVFATNLQYTAIVVAIIPVMVVYPFLQKYFVKGIIIGAVKG